KAGVGVRPVQGSEPVRRQPGVGGGKEAMVSQARKLRWGRMAFGLALVPALAVVNVAPAQTGPAASSFAADRGPDPAAGKPSADAKPAAAKSAAAKPAAPVKAADRYALVKQARADFDAGKLDEAKALAQQANTMGGTWGLFEDSPAKVLDDIQKSKGKADKTE